MVSTRLINRDQVLKGERAKRKIEMRLIKFGEAKATFEHRLGADREKPTQYKYDERGGTIWILGGETHCVNGPAIQSARGVAWKLYGDLHRNDGPAVIRVNGHNEWWLYGIMVQTYREFQIVTGCSGEDIVAYKLKWGEIERPRWRAGS